LWRCGYQERKKTKQWVQEQILLTSLIHLNKRTRGADGKRYGISASDYQKKAALKLGNYTMLLDKAELTQSS
jgi:hypothetical protein